MIINYRLFTNIGDLYALDVKKARLEIVADSVAEVLRSSSKPLTPSEILALTDKSQEFKLYEISNALKLRNVNGRWTNLDSGQWIETPNLFDYELYKDCAAIY